MWLTMTFLRGPSWGATWSRVKKHPILTLVVEMVGGEFIFIVLIAGSSSMLLMQMVLGVLQLSENAEMPTDKI